MVTLDIPKTRCIVLGTYMSNGEPQTLKEVLSEFVGEVNNEITRERIRIALERWNMLTGSNITIDDLRLN